MYVSLTETVNEEAGNLYNLLHLWLMDQYWGGAWNHLLTTTAVFIVTILAAALALFITQRVIVTVIRKIAGRTKTKWDDYLVERRFFSRLAHLVPAAVIYYSSEFFPGSWWTPLERFVLGYMIVVGIFVCISFLNALTNIYGTLEIAKNNPIKGFVQGAKLFVYLIGGVFLLATLIDRDPWKLIASIGAVTAVLLLVFKDSILGLVASIQIIANDLVRIGDWIEISKFGADGDVIDVTLTTIKVQNWDKTITTIPTYALISDSFKNWRGMQQSGGRRIMRAVNIDMATIKFCTAEMLRKFETFDVLKEYIRDKQKEVSEFNQQNDVNPAEAVNGRHLTNLGTFRAYLKEYLRKNPKIHPDMTFLVRQLPPTEHGLPIEIYLFSNDTDWVNFEELQGDIFDHILAVIPRFELAVYQSPTGNDVSRAIAGPGKAAAVSAAEAPLRVADC